MLGKTVILLGLLVGVVILSGLTFDNAFAAIDMFLKIDDIDGESTDAGHPDEIDVLKWSWGMSQSGPSHSGGGGSGKVNVQDMSITKATDSTTSFLMIDCCAGKNIGDVTLQMCRSSSAGGAPLCYFTIEMEKVFISSMSIGGSSEDEVLTETLTFNFDKVNFTYIPHDPVTGIPNPDRPETTWSIEEGKKV